MPRANRIAGSAFALAATAVLILSVTGLALSIRDWRSGDSSGFPLVGVALVLMAVGMVVEIPDFFADPHRRPTPSQRILRLALAAGTVMLLAAAWWIRRSGA